MLSFFSNHHQSFQVTVHGKAILGMTDSSSSLVIHSLLGDYSGQVTIRNGQLLDLTNPRALMPTSLLVLPGTDLYLPTILDCKNVDITIYGKYVLFGIYDKAEFTRNNIREKNCVTLPNYNFCRCLFCWAFAFLNATCIPFLGSIGKILFPTSY